MKPKRGKLRQVKPHGPHLLFQFNPETIEKSGGVGGWSEVQRPQRKPLQEWQGVPARRLSFSLFFDGFKNGESVEDQCRKLEGFGEPRAPGKRPPELEFEYGPIGAGHTWVVEDLAWGEELRGPHLHRIRQEVTVYLVEYVDADVTLSPADKHKESGGQDSGSSNRTYIVQAGDTLSSIAAKLLGDHKRWTEIAKLNDIRDPDSIKVNQRLRIPPS